MEPNRAIKPYMIEPVVHQNPDGPNRGLNSNGRSFDSSQDEDDFNMDRNWEHRLITIFVLYFTFSIKYYFIDFKHLYLHSSHYHMVSN